MAKDDAEKIRNTMRGQDYYFMNLYPYGVIPYWTAHTSPDLARADAREEVLHIAIPVHRDWFSIEEKKEKKRD